MTVSSENNRDDYTGNGAVDTYGYSFKIHDEADIKVTERDTDDVEVVHVLNVDYTVTGVGAEAGGTVVLTAGNLTTDHKLCIRRDAATVQLVEIRNEGVFYAEVHEDAWDYLCMVMQTHSFDIDRSIKLPDTVTGVSSDLPVPVASQLLSYNAAADAIITVDPGSISLAIPASDSVATAMLQDGAVTTVKITDGAITPAKIPDTSIQHAKIDWANLIVASSNTSEVILAGGNWVVPAGVYIMARDTEVSSHIGYAALQVFDGATWRGEETAFASGVIISDGTNVRIIETSTTDSVKFYYLKM